MMFGAWGNADRQACIDMVHGALDAGINFIDTADVYDFGTSEEIVGEALKALKTSRREQVIVATKVNNAMDDGPNHRGNSRRWIVHEVEASLRRLQTDYIDLYQIHRPDPDTDLDETLGALSDLIHQGKVRAIGTSTFPAELIVEGQWVAQQRGRERFQTEQPPYSILARGIEADVLPTCQRFGLSAIVWSPLNGGWLTGKYQRGAEPPPGSRAVREPDHFDYGDPVSQRKLDLVAELLKLAAEIGVSLTHLALAFVLSHPAVTSAIIGPRTMGQLTDQLGADQLTLDDDILDAIDQLVPPGMDVNPRDAGYAAPALADPNSRRRQR
jgi:aryl-alcohol dehydrogenase-like predicted oxidoreductase